MENDNANEKAKFFFDRKIKIHITTYNGSWYNGLILELSNKHLILNDRIVGETFVLFSDIKTLEKFKEK